MCSNGLECKDATLHQPLVNSLHLTGDKKMLKKNEKKENGA
jgi:hypothetical protein